jgi:hypothetical protein
MSDETTVGQRTLELVRNLDDGIYDEARSKDVTVSQLLERNDPTAEAPSHLANTDAFQRALIALGVRTRADRTVGLPASTLGDLYDAGDGVGRTLVPEFINRTMRVANMFGTRIGKMSDPFGAYRAAYGGERFYASNLTAEMNIDLLQGKRT